MTTTTRDLEGQLLRRSEQPEFEADESDERRFTFPFSSTAPVSRYFGDEVLEHEERSINFCLLYTSPSPRDVEESRMPSSA